MTHGYFKIGNVSCRIVSDTLLFCVKSCWDHRLKTSNPFRPFLCWQKSWWAAALRWRKKEKKEEEEEEDYLGISSSCPPPTHQGMSLISLSSSSSSSSFPAIKLSPLCHLQKPFKKKSAEIVDFGQNRQNPDRIVLGEGFVSDYWRNRTVSIILAETKRIL